MDPRGFGLTQEDVESITEYLSRPQAQLSSGLGDVFTSIAKPLENSFAELLLYPLLFVFVPILLGLRLLDWIVESCQPHPPRGTLKAYQSFRYAIRFYHLCVRADAETRKAREEQQEADRQLQAAAEAELARRRVRADYWRNLDGFALEDELTRLLTRLGHSARRTRHTGDEGVDIVLDGDTVIQCKCHAGPVSPATARDLFGTMHYFKAKSAILVSTQGFTTGTVEFAGKVGMVLWDADYLATLQEEALKGSRDGTSKRQECIQDTPSLSASQPSPLEIRTNPRERLEYVYVPPGRFEMGASPEDDHSSADEQPRHLVEIKQGYWLGRTPVTVAAYRLYCDATGKQMPAAPDFDRGWTLKDHPMVNVSWDNAVAYCQWATGRLPSEAEWEYAARAGTQECYWWGHGFDGARAWCHENSCRRTHAIGEKPANPWKLLDILGNVGEWCADCYTARYDAASPSPTSQGPTNRSPRVVRGGSWGDIPWGLRASYRARISPDHHDFCIGFRCVWDGRQGGGKLPPRSCPEEETKP